MNHATYECGECGFTIVDDTDDPTEFWDVVDDHETMHADRRSTHLDRILDDAAGALVHQGEETASTIRRRDGLGIAMTVCAVLAVIAAALWLAGLW
jgi:hypothetical protein